MRLITPLAAFAVVITCGCASVKITPTSVLAVSGRTQERDASLERWREAVRLCNAFLQSPHRVTLPGGALRLKDDAMEFVTGDTVLPVRIKCTTWGDWVVRTSMAAQERSDGFVVGLVRPRRSRLLDNSFFKDGNGRPRSSDFMAELILHELTHSYYRCGTVSFPKTMDTMPKQYSCSGIAAIPWNAFHTKRAKSSAPFGVAPAFRWIQADARVGSPPRSSPPSHLSLPKPVPVTFFGASDMHFAQCLWATCHSVTTFHPPWVPPP